MKPRYYENMLQLCSIERTTASTKNLDLFTTLVAQVGVMHLLLFIVYVRATIVHFIIFVKFYET